MNYKNLPAVPKIEILDEPSFVWETKKHELVPIHQMDDNHLLNCIRLLQRHPGWRSEFIEPMMIEAKLRGLFI